MTKKQKAIIFTAVILIIIGSVFEIYWLCYGRYYQSTDDAYIKGNVTTISSRVAGYIVARHVKDNAFVKAGESLVSLDDRDFKVQEAKAIANLNQQKAHLTSLDATQVVNRDQVAQAQAKIKQAQAKLMNDESEQRRIVDLIKRKYASQSQLDTINTTVISDKAAVVAAEAVHQSAKDQIALTDTEIKQAKAAVEAAKAALAQAQLNLSYTTIRAPVNGIITNRSVEKGMYVSPGMPLFSLVPLSTIWVVANFKETQLKSIKPGQSVTISVDAYSGKKLYGMVDSITPGSGSEFALLPTDNATGNFTKVVQRVPVKIRITNDNHLKDRLYPGLSVEVRINTRSG